MKIGELSQKTGASIRSIRHYEKKNLITSKRLDNGYRVFDESCISRIKTIQLYLGLGLTTDQIDGILNCDTNNPQAAMDDLCEDLLNTYEEKLGEVRGQIRTLSIVEYRLEKQIERFKERIAEHEKKEV